MIFSPADRWTLRLLLHELYFTSSIAQIISESKQKVVTPNVINSIYMIWYIDTKLV